MEAEKKLREIINPRKLKWTIYGSFIQLAIIFILILFVELGWFSLPFDVKIIILYGCAMSILSINNTKTRYEKLDIALTVQPIFCPHCQPHDIAMAPSEYLCPECKSTSKKGS